MEEPSKKLCRCAIYTRKSTEYNLDLEFNSLDAQREACEAYIRSQAHEGWRLIPTRYDDGAFSGASLDRPALQELLAGVRSGKIDVIIVYKVDRLTRSLTDFAKLVELFDAEREGKAERYIRFLAPLAFLSPRIVRSIAEGSFSANLKVTKLVKMIDCSWTEQEHCLLDRA
jgi:hypothetical protein